MRVRDISGNILFTLAAYPKGSLVTVPSLGAVADKYVDAATYLPSAILHLHTSALKVYEHGEEAAIYFVRDMKACGMSHMEAAFIWEIMDVQAAGQISYRQRMPLGIE